MIYPVLVVILLSAMGVVGDYFIKVAGRGTTPIDIGLFSIGFIVYMSTVPGWFLVMKYLPLSVLGAVYAVSTVLLLVAVGVFWFNERLTLTEIVGVGLAVTAVVVLRRLS